MKFSVATLLLLPAMASAFAPSQRVVVSSSSALSAAKTFEEDLQMTREVITKFMESQGETVSSEPAAPKKESKKEEAAQEE
jgi:predicted RNase H-like HicB family nuclease